MLINIAEGDGYVDIGMPVELLIANVGAAENADIKSALAGSIRQVLSTDTRHRSSG